MGDFAITLLDGLLAYLPKHASFTCKILDYIFCSKNTNLKLPPFCGFLRSKRLEREHWPVQATQPIQIYDLHGLLPGLSVNF